MSPEDLSRREIVTAGGSLLAAPLWMGIGSGSANGNSAPAIARLMQNPLNEYPKPPFKAQYQEPPGLARKMDPQLNHGEKSYEGAGYDSSRNASKAICARDTGR